MRQITLTVMKKLMNNDLLDLRYPVVRVNSEARIYAKTVAYEDNPAEWVWCDDP